MSDGGGREWQGRKYAFFCHAQCESFPCHAGIAPEDFNCLFCYCPLFHAENCGGTFALLPGGEKDCSACALPHAKENYGAVLARLRGDGANGP